MPFDARALLRSQGWQEGKGLTDKGRALPVTVVQKDNLKGVGARDVEITDNWDDVYNKVSRRMSIKTASSNGQVTVHVAEDVEEQKQNAISARYSGFQVDMEDSFHTTINNIQSTTTTTSASSFSSSSSSSSSSSVSVAVERKMEATMYAKRSSGKLKRLYSQEAEGLAAFKKRQKTLNDAVLQRQQDQQQEQLQQQQQKRIESQRQQDESTKKSKKKKKKDKKKKKKKKKSSKRGEEQ